MIRFAPARVISTLAVTAFCAALLLPVGTALAEEAVHYTKESVQAYEQQLSSGQITAATFNKRVRNLHLTLKDGTHALVHYPPKDEPTLAGQLAAKKIPVTVLTPTQAKSEAAKAPVHHKLRYIVGGIVIAVVVIVGAVLLVDRRRKRLAE
jgi:hypothetical protein